MRRSVHRVVAVLVSITLAGCMSTADKSVSDATSKVRTYEKSHTQASAGPHDVAPPATEMSQADDEADAEALEPAPEPVSRIEGGVVGGVIGGTLGGQLAGGPGGTAVGLGSGKGVPSAPPPPAKIARDLAAEPKPSHPRGEPRTDGNAFVAEKPNPFVDPDQDRFSTFAIDVDTASYSLMRTYAQQRALPPRDSVRVEEWVNYFKYRYAPPTSGAFRVELEGSPSPFTKGHHLVRVGVQGKVVSRSERKQAHLTFLVDTSGSMSGADRLELAKQAMKIALKNLGENDTVAIATYAGGTQLVLPSTPAADRARILRAIDSLHSGGGTAMGSGMELAYKQAVKKASGNVVSRVIVLTDGDTNIGPNLSADAMLESVRKYVSEGVTLTTVGFGMGNYRDDLMERLANKGNGNCFYVDSLREAKKVFETQLTGTLEVIAKDVKIQVEFDPEAVAAYRLVGYENRDIADHDFRNDKVDAGEIGAGHSVTALYEVQLKGDANQLGTVRIRAKAPNGTQAKEQAFALTRAHLKPSISEATADLRFATAVAGAADVLRGNPASETWSLATAEKLAKGSTEGDADREEFVKLLATMRAEWSRRYSVSAR